VLVAMNHPERCKKIESMIKTLSQTQYEELFKILQKNNCEYTVNNNGIFLNLSWINSALLDKIELFINFCNKSKRELDRYEQICKDLNDDLRHEEKEVAAVPVVEEEEVVVSEQDVRNKPKVSSSMRFYLLKKKFAKGVAMGNYENVLEKESPVIVKKMRSRKG
jgi:hypothetical protein